jgi:hypothetical protein
VGFSAHGGGSGGPGEGDDAGFARRGGGGGGGGGGQCRQSRTLIPNELRISVCASLISFLDVLTVYDATVRSI